MRKYVALGMCLIVLGFVGTGCRSNLSTNDAQKESADLAQFIKNELDAVDEGPTSGLLTGESGEVTESTGVYLVYPVNSSLGLVSRAHMMRIGAQTRVIMDGAEIDTRQLYMDDLLDYSADVSASLGESGWVASRIELSEVSEDVTPMPSRVDLDLPEAPSNLERLSDGRLNLDVVLGGGAAQVEDARPSVELWVQGEDVGSWLLLNAVCSGREYRTAEKSVGRVASVTLHSEDGSFVLDELKLR